MNEKKNLSPILGKRIKEKSKATNFIIRTPKNLIKKDIFPKEVTLVKKITEKIDIYRKPVFTNNFFLNYDEDEISKHGFFKTPTINEIVEFSNPNFQIKKSIVKSKPKVVLSIQKKSKEEKFNFNLNDDHKNIIKSSSKVSYKKRQSSENHQNRNLAPSKLNSTNFRKNNIKQRDQQKAEEMLLNSILINHNKAKVTKHKRNSQLEKTHPLQLLISQYLIKKSSKDLFIAEFRSSDFHISKYLTKYFQI